jgi:hypothetical protein
MRSATKQKMFRFALACADPCICADAQLLQLSTALFNAFVQCCARESDLVTAISREVIAALLNALRQHVQGN